MNYISLLKRRSFIMIIMHPVVFNAFLDISTLYIVIIVNFTSKILIFNKSIYLDLIYEYIDTLYIIINITKTFIIVVIAFTTISELFTTI